MTATTSEGRSDANPMGIEAQLPRGTMILLTMAAAMLVIAGMRSFASTIGPVFLALVIVVVVYPIQGWLRGKGAPSAVAFLALLASAFGVVFAIVGSLVWAAAELVGLVTSESYRMQLQTAQADLTAALDKFNITDEDVGGIAQNLDIGTIASQITSALSGILGLFSAAALLLITMFFMTMDAGKFGSILSNASRQRPGIVSGLQGFAESTRSYFVVSTVFGLIVAVLDTALLMWLGIPLAIVWGIISLITNYIPNIGFMIGLAPPALLAFFEGGWEKAAWVIVAYTVINVIIQSLIQPRFVGDAVGLSTTLTFLSLIFWGWVLGPLGALLAVPMTLLAKALLVDIDPTTQWARPLIALQASEPPDSGVAEVANQGEEAELAKPTA